jgi:hypothetical protein
MVDGQEVTFTPHQRGDHWSERLEAISANHRFGVIADGANSRFDIQ